MLRRVNHNNQTIVSTEPGHLESGWFRFVDKQSGLVYDYAEHTWTKKLAAFAWRLGRPACKFKQVAENVYEVE